MFARPRAQGNPAVRGLRVFLVEVNIPPCSRLCSCLAPDLHGDGFHALVPARWDPPGVGKDPEAVEKCVQSSKCLVIVVAGRQKSWLIKRQQKGPKSQKHWYRYL